VSAVHQQAPPIRYPEGFVWRCSCGERGPLAPDRETARQSFIVHREKKRERVQ